MPRFLDGVVYDQAFSIRACIIGGWEVGSQLRLRYLDGSGVFVTCAREHRIYEGNVERCRVAGRGEEE